MNELLMFLGFGLGHIIYTMDGLSRTRSLEIARTILHDISSLALNFMMLSQISECSVMHMFQVHVLTT